MAEQRPRELSPEELEAAARASAGEAAPTLLPPEAAGAGEIAAWQSDKRITALWGINQNRNSWVGISGVGWKRLANNLDSAVVALTLLAAHAKQMQARVDYREEADALIHEMYVW